MRISSIQVVMLAVILTLSIQTANAQRRYTISEVEHYLRNQGAHFGKDYTDTEGRDRWVFFYPTFHGIPVSLSVVAYPTKDQLDTANYALLWEISWVYKWLQQTGAVQ